MRRVVLVALVVVACGGGPEPVVAPPPLHVTAKPPAPPRARWVFSAPEQEIRAKLDLGDHKTLYVGDHGRRELDAGGQLQHAEALAEEALAGVLRDDKGRYVFVATDGDTYTSSEPLGPLERVTPPRTEPLASVTTGKAAILGISPAGLVRSTDWGATWKPVDYAGKAVGHAASVALDTKGNGVLVQLPQRVLVTRDDGATWAPLASPQYGAARVIRDGSDRVFVVGYHDMRATLAGDKLAESNDLPAPIFPGGHAAWEPRAFRLDTAERLPLRVRQPVELMGERHVAPMRLLAGDHVVEIADHDKKTEIRSAALGDALGAPSVHVDLGDGIFDENRVASFGGELVYASTDVDDDDDDKAAKSPTTTILRSKDFGATWKKEDALQGTPRESTRAIALGPRGWTYVGPLCAKKRSSECKAPKIRAAGKQTFEDAGADEAFEAFTFDEAHDKVYALAAASGGSVLYEGALGGSKLTRTSVLLAARPDRVAMTVDDRGALRVFERSGRAVTVHERSAKGEEQPARYLDLGAVTIAFAGKRGLAVGNHASYETNDAGETWTRVPSNGATREIACGGAGCLLADAQRVGWDLPAVQSTEVVRAQTTAPTEQPQVKPHVRPQVANPVKLACKPSGKGGPVDESGQSWVDGTGAVKWARTSTSFDTGALSLTYADGALHQVSLFGPPGASTMQVRTGTDERDEGIVAARYRFARRSATGKLNPVQVELAWWSPAKPQVRRGTLQAVKPFRVSSFGFSGRGRVVEGGVIFQGGYGDEIHFVHDDGKSETLAAPPIAFQEAWHSGKRWLLLDADDAVIEMAVSDDGGKSWSLRGWAFGPMNTYGDANLETAGGKLVMRAGEGVYEIAWPVAGDPPAGASIDASSKDARCDGLAFGTTTHVEHVEGDSPVTMDLGGATYTAGDRVFHDSATGKLCTSAYQMEQGNRAAYLFADKNGAWSGWAFRNADEKATVEPFSCK